MNKVIKIQNHIISNEFPPYIIAELSANHNGSIDRAFRSIKAAKDSGANAVKIQTYTADTMTIKSNRNEFKIDGGLWDGYDLYSLYKWAETPYDWHKPLFDYAEEVGITIFSTPFDETAVDLLENLDSPAYKIASFEMTDLPLVKLVAQTKKPMIISTGMANMDEINEVIETSRQNGCQDLILLHCISSYPAPVDESNLRTIPDLADRFGVLSGLSDHTMGTTVAVAATAVGACMIEKHFTLSRADKGPDSDFSLEPSELKRLCEETIIAHKSLGLASYELKDAERAGLKFRRSLYAIRDIKKGEEFTKQNIRSIRPSNGLPPRYYENILGTESPMGIKSGTPLNWKNSGLDQKK